MACSALVYTSACGSPARRAASITASTRPVASAAAKPLDASLKRAAHQRFQEPGRSLDGWQGPAPLESERHCPAQVPPQARIRARQPTVHAVVLEHAEEPAHQPLLLEAGEEHLQLPGLCAPLLGLARCQFGYAPPGLGEVEGPGLELEEAELVHDGDLVEAQVLARLRELLDCVGKEERPPVGRRRRRPELTPERRQRLQVEVAARDPLREERKQTLGLDEVHAGGCRFHPNFREAERRRSRRSPARPLRRP